MFHATLVIYANVIFFTGDCFLMFPNHCSNNDLLEAKPMIQLSERMMCVFYLGIKIILLDFLES